MFICPASQGTETSLLPYHSDAPEGFGIVQTPSSIFFAKTIDPSPPYKKGAETMEMGEDILRCMHQSLNKREKDFMFKVGGRIIKFFRISSIYIDLKYTSQPCLKIPLQTLL